MSKSEYIVEMLKAKSKGLRAATKENVAKVIKRSHDRANELAKNKKPEDWTEKDMKDSVKEFKQQEYADKKFAVSCSFTDKYNYIKETIATMMDVQPIQVVGKEHPAKQDKKCKNHQTKEEHS